MYQRIFSESFTCEILVCNLFNSRYEEKQLIIVNRREDIENIIDAIIIILLYIIVKLGITNNKQVILFLQ